MKLSIVALQVLTYYPKLSRNNVLSSLN